MQNRLEDPELLLISSDRARLEGDDVEVDGLAERTALANLDNITLLDYKGRAAVSRDLSVPLLETLVLGNPVKVVAANNDCAAHLCRNNNTPHQTATD